MKHTILCLVAFIASGLFASAGTGGQAFAPGELWPDTDGVHINAHGGGILYHLDTYYWCGQHMVAGVAGNSAMVGVGMYSSKDLYHWKNEGIVLPVADDPESEITKGCVLERPKVVFNQRTGKFVMWFHLELKGQRYNAALSGVAVADRVTGPFTYLGSFRPNAGAWPANVPDALKTPLTHEEAAATRGMVFSGPAPNYPRDRFFRFHHAGGQMARDMNLFVDDDGKAYHIYTSEHNGTLHVSRLSDDYLKPSGQYVRIFPGDFNEAPAVFKHQGKYYMITSGCTGWAPNPARLSVADHIFGPWKTLGNPCIGPDAQTRVTFDSQATFVLPVHGKTGQFIFMADRWRPQNAIDGRYVWLPVRFDKDGKPFLEWIDRWDLNSFDARKP